MNHYYIVTHQDSKDYLYRMSLFEIYRNLLPHQYKPRGHKAFYMKLLPLK